MATLESIPMEFYRPDTDDYLLPGGKTFDGWRVRAAKRERDDRIDAARGYDPYNHSGYSAANSA